MGRAEWRSLRGSMLSHVHHFVFLAVVFHHLLLVQKRDAVWFVTLGIMDNKSRFRATTGLSVSCLTVSPSGVCVLQCFTKSCSPWNKELSTTTQRHACTPAHLAYIRFWFSTNQSPTKVRHLRTRRGESREHWVGIFRRRVGLEDPIRSSRHLMIIHPHMPLRLIDVTKG
jgi:hypothetical protein